MPRVGVGETLGAQVRHLVTYRDPPEGTLLYTVFTKNCQKRCKKGVPPVFHIPMWAAEIADLGRDPDPGSERRVLYSILS